MREHEGRILKGIAGFYYAQTEDGEVHTLRAQNKLRHQKLKPMVGDHVRFTEGSGEEYGWVSVILERETELLRPPVANIQTMVLLVACASPDPDLLLIDRMLLCCREAGIEPMLVVAKAELNPLAAEAIAKAYKGTCALSLAVSAVTGQGVSELRQAVFGKIHAFSGQSGVGKSTLINALYGLKLATGTISDRTQRGKHTTRHCELIPLSGGGMVLDTPGFSLLDLHLRDPIMLKELYPEFKQYEDEGCRFQPCAHYKEPDCLVRQAVSIGKINSGRYERYQALFEEMNQRWRDRYG